MYDLKPGAPAEYRGPFTPIATKLFRCRRFVPYLRGRPRPRCFGGEGRSNKAASFRKRLTTTTPAARSGLRKGRLAYAPSATTHTVFPATLASAANESICSTASCNLVRNSQAYLA